ncbi:MAG: ATP-dependent helicase [Anaerolineaceae bacterium]|nr:ATP-dependent helicase [Anaerolineaceae bacterium]
MFKPRPKQQTVVDFTQGRMGVAAVPGSGKTQTLSFLAARLIHEGYLDDTQEVLVVTLTNSGVGNFESRISGYIENFGLLPRMGFRVRTLHGLAHDIVRERPDLVGLPTQFNIIDDREAYLMLESSVRDWLLTHPEFQETYLADDIRVDHKFAQTWNTYMIGLSGAFIKTAKDLQADDFEIRAHMRAMEYEDPLLNLGCDVYKDYTRKLSLREGVDFDDLIRYALAALKTDSEYLARLRRRWPYILEDEAQDSSCLQQEILELLTGDNGNWVRVGDPNQAIFETFTTANPELLREFIAREDVVRADLPNSGRSTRSIIELANHLVEWTTHNHPIKSLRNALFEAYIEPTPPGDPQPNPVDEETTIRIAKPTERRTSKAEIEEVVQRIQRWKLKPEAENQTMAVLVPTNRHGESLIKALKENQIEYIELLKNTAETRQTALDLEAILLSLANPGHQKMLRRAYAAMRKPRLVEDLDEKATIKAAADLIRRAAQVEDFLHPLGGKDWLAEISRTQDEAVIAELEWLRTIMVRWQEAVLLPIDQLILTIANDLYDNTVDLALSHKFAQMLEFYSRSHREWQLSDFAAQLHDIATSRRGFSGFSDNDTGFDPDKHAGKVTVATIHKSKGLEWDIVYLLSANNYDFPSLDPYDNYFSEKWFIREKLNLQEEMLSKLKAVVAGDDEQLSKPEGAASEDARVGIAEERLRLLYVGITRARKELHILWNLGLREKCQPARALGELYRYWKERDHAS